MEKDTAQTHINRRERILQHAFYSSGEGFRRMATIAGAAIVVDGGEATIGAGAKPPITKEGDPKLYKAYQNWLIDTGRSS